MTETVIEERATTKTDQWRERLRIGSGVDATTLRTVLEALRA